MLQDDKIAKMNEIFDCVTARVAAGIFNHATIYLRRGGIAANGCPIIIWPYDVANRAGEILGMLVNNRIFDDMRTGIMDHMANAIWLLSGQGYGTDENEIAVRRISTELYAAGVREINGAEFMWLAGTDLLIQAYEAIVYTMQACTTFKRVSAGRVYDIAPGMIGATLRSAERIGWRGDFLLSISLPPVVSDSECISTSDIILICDNLSPISEGAFLGNSSRDGSPDCPNTPNYGSAEISDFYKATETVCRPEHNHMPPMCSSAATDSRH